MIDRAEYAALDAIDLAGLIRKGEVAHEEVLSAALDAIDQVNPSIQAVADASELAGAKGVSSHGPLGGVPFLLKDLGMFRAGFRSEGGSRMCRDFRPPFTSTLVERYDGAGLVSLGRTKSPEFGFSPTTEPKLYGPVKNPWNTAHSSGGSSGGAAAAVAAGCVPVAHANDAGGSIRIPAACCGVFGLKPTRGRIPCGPAFSETVCGLGADHVVSRSVRDSALVLDLTQGPAPGDPYGVSKTINSHLDFVERPLKKLRIGLWSNAWSGASLAPDVAEALEAAAKLCADIGHEIEPVEPGFGTSWEAFLDANATIWCSNVASLVDFFSGILQRPITSDYLEEATLAAYRHGKQRSATDILTTAGTFNTVSRSAGALFARFDVILSPVMIRTTPLLGDFVAFRSGMSGFDWCRTIFDQLPFTPLFNVTGGPAASVPLGKDRQGMPVGIQIGADLGNEGLLLNLARQFEEIAPWVGNVPKIHAAN